MSFAQMSLRTNVTQPNLHAERFVAFLEAAHGEELEGVDVVAEVDANFLLSDL